MPRKEYAVYGNGPTGQDVVITDDQGNVVENVTSASISLDPGGINTMTLDIMVDKLNIVVKLDTVWLRCPLCQTIVCHDDCDPVPETLSGT